MTTIETIQQVAAFAADPTTPGGWDAAVIKDGRIHAQSPTGGACAPLPEDVGAGLEVAVQAKALLKALRAVRGPEVALAQPKKHQLLVASGDRSAQLDTYGANEVPKFHEPAKATNWLPAVGLDRLERLAWACSKDEARRHLHGFCLKADYAAATNGHVLVRQDVALEGLETEILVPPGVVKGLPPECWYAVAGNRLFITTEEPTKGQRPVAWRCANLIDAVFPPLDQVLDPALKAPAATAPAAGLVDMLKSARISGKSLVLEVEGQRLQVKTDRARGNALFDFADSVKLEDAQHLGEGIVGVDADYLIPMVGAVQSDQLELRATLLKEYASLEPVSVAADGYAAVVMPIRL